MQEAKANEFVMMYDPESITFLLERLATMTRLSVTRNSRTNTLNGAPSSSQSYVVDRPEPARQRSSSSEDIPTISLDPPTSGGIEADIIDNEQAAPLPSLVTPRLLPVSPMRSRPTQEIESSD